MKKLSIIFCICTLLLCSLLAGCGSKEPAPAADHKLRVVVTFNAMKEFTQAVGQDKIHITSLIPDGTEPHDFQPTTKTMQALSKADILIYNSTGMERWVEQATQAAANPKLVIVEAARGTDRISLTEADEIRAHGQYDPHTWLSLSCAQTEVKNIAEALATADKTNADFYRKNAAEYNQKLQALLAAYQKKCSQLEQKDFVTGHAAFAYLCRDFGLQQQSIEDVFASGEPSAQNLAKLTAYCKEHNVKTIFVEEAVSPKTSETLAREVGATTQEIYTIECSNGEKNYLTRMEENLDAIYKSLKK